MIRYFIFLSVFIFLSLQTTKGQGIGIGEWRTHLPYTNGIRVVDAGDLVYCASGSGLFSYNKTDNSIEKLSKVTGLSDVSISTMVFDKSSNTLVIVYHNANIDLIQNNQITNISDIKRKTILGNKDINDVHMIGEYAYISCGFGIVVIDIIKKEVKDTYIIGPDASFIDVSATTTDGVNLVASTEDGIYYAPLSNPNLANYSVWNKYNTPAGAYGDVCFVNGILYAQFEHTDHDTVFMYDGNTWDRLDVSEHNDVKFLDATQNKLIVGSFGYFDVYDGNNTMVYHFFEYGFAAARPQQVVIDDEGIYWIADFEFGLVKFEEPYSFTAIYPNGPESKSVSAIDAVAGDVWAVSGGKNDIWGGIGNRSGIYSYINDVWDTQNGRDGFGLDTIEDMITVAVNPNDPSVVYAGSWGKGLLEFTDGQLSNVYNHTNSSLQKTGLPFYHLRVGGLKYDSQGNLWVSNSDVKRVFSVLKPNGEWKSFDPGGAFGQNTTFSIEVNDVGQKWLLTRELGILVFDDGGTIDNTNDDQYKRLTSTIGNGGLPSNDIYSLASDHDGEMWVGTSKGVAVFYSPSSIFQGGNFDCQQILVEQDGFAQYLLESELVTSIAIDGGNRKWLGTQSAGAFLMSEDGTEEIYHFTQENSPLLSNSITSIAIDHETGEVYFGTSEGIVSFKSTATGGGETNENVYAYPNPVRNDYSGPVAVKGLVKNADVKITDVSGNLMFATTAEGGQVVWSGKGLDGQRAKTGVYLVFASNEDGSETVVTKILFVN